MDSQFLQNEPEALSRSTKAKWKDEWMLSFLLPVLTVYILLLTHSALPHEERTSFKVFQKNTPEYFSF